jgi:crossover junction endodeoxyribonuclease RusA
VAVALVNCPRELVLELTIPGEPVPKARVRVTRRGTYTPAKTLHHEMDIEILARQFIKTPVRGPIVFDADFFMGNNRRVDWDNLAKCATDALNGIAWADDSQIVQAHVGKWVDREQPRTELRVWRIG